MGREHAPCAGCAGRCSGRDAGSLVKTHLTKFYQELLMNSFVTGAVGSVSDGRAQALSLAGHTVMRCFVFHSFK